MASQPTDVADRLTSAMQEIVVIGEPLAKPNHDDDAKSLEEPESPDNPEASCEEDADEEAEAAGAEVPELTAEQIAASVKSFYTDAQHYWDGIEPTVDGMLGGFAPINAIDIRGSLAYLQSLFRLRPAAPGRRCALDCGAGIGRVTKHLLLSQFEQVDAVEQNARFAAEMRGYVGASPKLGRIYNEGLQEFRPDEGRYDVIWSQWVLGHLTDVDLVAFFGRCVRGLRKNGVMVLKENVTSSDRTEIDEVDSSLTRPLAELRRLLGLGGMQVIRSTMQTNFPAGIYPVYMITAKPV